MLDRFTIKAAEALQEAEKRTAAMGHGELSPLHLLAAIVSPTAGPNGGGSGGIAVPLLEKAGACLHGLAGGPYRWTGCGTGWRRSIG